MASGVDTPLAFPFLRYAVPRAYRRALMLVGVSVAVRPSLDTYAEGHGKLLGAGGITPGAEREPGRVRSAGWTAPPRADLGAGQAIDGRRTLDRERAIGVAGRRG